MNERQSIKQRWGHSSCPFCLEMLVLSESFYPHRCKSQQERQRLTGSMKDVELRYWDASPRPETQHGHDSSGEDGKVKT